MVASVILAGLILLLAFLPAEAIVFPTIKHPPIPARTTDINLSVKVWAINGNHLEVFINNTGDDLVGNYSLVLYRGLKSQSIWLNGTLRRSDTEEISNVPYFEAKGAELRSQTGALLWRAEDIYVEYF